MLKSKVTSLLIVLVWAMIIGYLVYISERIYGVLVYDESKLVPSNIEPVIVDRIIQDHLGREQNVTMLVVLRVNSTEDAMRKLELLESGVNTLDVLTLHTIYEEALRIYNEFINANLSNLTRNLGIQIEETYNNASTLCSELVKLNREYYNMVQTLEYELSATLNEATNMASMLAGKIGQQTNQTHIDIAGLLDSIVHSLSGNTFTHRLGNATLRIINSTVGPYPSPLELASLNLTQIVMKAYLEALNQTYPVLYDYVSIYGIDPSRLPNYVLSRMGNNSLLRSAVILGPQVDSRMLRLLVQSMLINNTPPIIRPYLGRLTCSEVNTSMLVEDITKDLRRYIVESNPPPTLRSLNATKYFLNGTYTIALLSVPSSLEIRIYEWLISSLPWAYPVSSDALLHDLQGLISNDVGLIDRTTSVLVFVTLLLMIGTLVGPIVILATLGLTYLATLGLLYLVNMLGIKVFYLVIYLIAPVMFGIGVDYSMLLLGRYIEERSKGLAPLHALKEALRKTEFTILASAAIVALGLGSYLLSTYQYIQVIGLGFIIASIATAIAVLLVIPSIMSLLRDRILWPMGLRTRVRELRSELLVRMARYAVNKPKRILGIYVAVTIIALVYVLIHIKITTNPTVLMPSTPAKQGLELLDKYFRVYDYSTAYVVVMGDEKAALDMLNSLRNQSYIGGPSGSARITYNGTGLYIIEAPVKYNLLSDDLIGVYLSMRSLADSVERDHNATILLGGSPAYKYYFSVGFMRQFYGFIAYIIVVVNVVILAVYMRSIVIPLRLIATVLMSVAWALAVAVLVFQDLMSTSMYWLMPVILYSLLISVGTDYDLFIMSRFKEELRNSKSDAEAIIKAVESTGPVVTGAALVLAMAFASLSVSSLLILKEVALAVAAAVIMDSFLVRPMLVPSILVLLGKHNWWPFGKPR